MTRKHGGVKQYEGMSRGELRRVAAAFDEEMVVEKSRALTAAEAAWWDRVRRRPGRPRRGSGARVISVTVERELLARSDALAQSLGISRGLLIERGLRAVLAAQGSTYDATPRARPLPRGSGPKKPLPKVRVDSATVVAALRDRP